MTEPIGLSTSWNGPGLSPDRVLDEARALGFRRIEAYAHYTPDGLTALARRASEREMHIGSLHGPCPAPSPMIGDWLASTNANERQRAVDAYLRTIDAAGAVGARAVVIHLGNSGVVSRQAALFSTIATYGRGSAQHTELRERAWAEREAVKGPALAAALDSMRTLGEHAQGTGVRLGVEIRDGYHEIPAFDEFADVLQACDGLPVGYWHDAGHGAKQQYLGFFEHEAYLRRYASQMVGMHIHDTRDGRDHMAPGLGDTDFTMLARYLTEPGVMRTLELHRTQQARDISAALDLLEPLGVFGVREGILVEL